MSLLAAADAVQVDRADDAERDRLLVQRLMAGAGAGDIDARGVREAADGGIAALQIAATVAPVAIDFVAADGRGQGLVRDAFLLRVVGLARRRRRAAARAARSSRTAGPARARVAGAPAAARPEGVLLMLVAAAAGIAAVGVAAIAAVAGRRRRVAVDRGRVVVAEGVQRIGSSARSAHEDQSGDGRATQKLSG